MLIQINITSKTGAGGVKCNGRAFAWVLKVVGSIPSRDIPKIVKIWYKQLPCLRSVLKGDWLELLQVCPVSAYNVTEWGAPVKYQRQEHSSVAALAIKFYIAVFIGCTGTYRKLRGRIEVPPRNFQRHMSIGFIQGWGAPNHTLISLPPTRYAV